MTLRLAGIAIMGDIKWGCGITKIKLSRKQEIIVSLLIAATFGVVWGSIFPYGSYKGSELSIVEEGLFIRKGQVINAQSMRNGTTTYYVFPPPLYVFEWIEFNVDVRNSSGGVLEINFTRDGNILRTELVDGSRSMVLSGYGEYRIREPNIDVTFRALNADVRIRWLYIRAGRGLKQFNPLVSAIGYTGAAALIILWIYLPRKMREKQVQDIVLG